MKYFLIRFLSAAMLLTGFFSCTKSNSTGPAPASLSLINAVPGSNPLVTNFSGTTPITWYNSALQLYYGQFSGMNQYAVNGATQPLALYQYPDTLAHSKPLFNLLLPFSPGENRTLFLTGTLAQPDTLFVTDKLPYHPFADSSIGLRFVNLSPGSAPVIVRINGLSSNPVTGSLPFKGITGFMNVPATAATGSYVVEFYDQATNTLLGNYTLGNVGATTGNNSWRYFNFTLALQGLPGVTSGATAQSVFLIRHYFSF